MLAVAGFCPTAEIRLDLGQPARRTKEIPSIVAKFTVGRSRERGKVMGLPWS
ncbi:hypothetical protein ACLOJK_034813, partial [Asimina triloba]